jgi:CBS domain-containing protein
MAETVRDTMTTQPRTVERSRPVADAARMMRDQNVGSLPVVEAARAVLKQHGEKGHREGE